jgi:hypothetical protein
MITTPKFRNVSGSTFHAEIKKEFKLISPKIK